MVGKFVPAKYQLHPRILTHCTLTVIEATESEFRTYVGVRNMADTQAPVGAKFYVKSPVRGDAGKGRLEFWYIRVKAVEEIQGRILHHCTPLMLEKREEMREKPRAPVETGVILRPGETVFKAVDGSLDGMSLLYESSQTIPGLSLETVYPFDIQYRDKHYRFEANVRHLFYNWKTFEHRIGIRFEPLNDEQETILNLLLDPNFTIKIPDKRVVDPVSGKISLTD